MCTAYIWALRSTCARRRVGAVIVDGNYHVLSTGFNGVPSEAPHCIDVPCPGAKAESGTDLDRCYAIHAEQNAVRYCPHIDRAFAIYTTTQPCIRA
jgi:dCMP deaminase